MILIFSFLNIFTAYDLNARAVEPHINLFFSFLRGGMESSFFSVPGQNCQFCIDNMLTCPEFKDSDEFIVVEAWNLWHLDIGFNLRTRSHLRNIWICQSSVQGRGDLSYFYLGGATSIHFGIFVEKAGALYEYSRLMEVFGFQFLGLFGTNNHSLKNFCYIVDSSVKLVKLSIVSFIFDLIESSV